MSPQHLKRFLVGAAFASVAVPGAALADPTCAYVIAQVASYTVTTPAVAIVVPEGDGSTQPVRVHVDETDQTILGYSVRAPGADVETEGEGVFVPGISQHIPSVSATLPELNFTPSRCVNVDGISTPAVPVYIPASAITLPGATGEVGSIIINLLGGEVTTPGQYITFDGTTIIIPAQEGGVPSVPVGTPEQTIIVDINGAVSSAHYLVPPNP